MANRIQSLLGIPYPIVQALMTYIARAELAAAVSEAGGLGMIETLTPEGRADLHRVREFTAKPVAANLMIQGWKKDPTIVDVLAEAGVRHVFSSAGDPALFTGRLHAAGMMPVSPTPVRCHHASPNCCRSPRSCERRGPGSTAF